jgi:D-beta-D-heptose 7-phosphate kinase/D-beta-D-heptose 1-phosphate adenosyltransferase
MVNILLIGESCRDEYIYGDCTRLNPESPVPVLRVNREVTRPGMAGKVREYLSEYGTVKLVTNNETIIRTRFVGTHGVTQQLLRVDRDAICAPLTSLPCLGYDAIAISDYDKGLLTSDWIAELARQSPVPVFLDTKKPDLSKFGGCIIKINDVEWCRLQSQPPVDADLIVTMGGRGARWNHTIYPSPSVTVHDVCGAGDIFFANLVGSYLTNGSLAKAIEFANARTAEILSKGNP